MTTRDRHIPNQRVVFQSHKSPNSCVPVTFRGALHKQCDRHLALHCRSVLHDTRATECAGHDGPPVTGMSPTSGESSHLTNHPIRACRSHFAERVHKQCDRHHAPFCRSFPHDTRATECAGHDRPPVTGTSPTSE